MNVEIDPDEVRRTGATLFPALASEFRLCEFALGDAQDRYGADALNGFGFLETWAAYNSLISLAVGTSAGHLEECGRVLVDIADDHDWTDEDNSRGIGDSHESSVDAETGSDCDERDR